MKFRVQHMSSFFSHLAHPNLNPGSMLVLGGMRIPSGTTTNNRADFAIVAYGYDG